MKTQSASFPSPLKWLRWSNVSTRVSTKDESNDGDQGKDKKQIKRLGNPTLIMVGLNENTSFSPPH